MHFSPSSRTTLACVWALTLFPTITFADSTSDLPDLSSAAASQLSAAAAASTSDDAAKITTDASSSTTTDTSSTGTTSGGPLATISGTGTVETTNTDSVPTISNSAALPTLTAIQSGADTVNTYPAPSVPPTSNAPFMQQSSLPSGTVFIVVGAILGFATIVVLAWRAFLSWSLDRAVKKAALQNNMADAKSHFRPPPMYKDYKDGHANISLGPIKKTRKDSRPPTAAEDPSRQSLFFSPTAGPGASITHSNRGSSYLPSGYYAAGSAANVSGNGGLSPGISLSNLSTQAQGYQRARDMGTPPDSPSFPARRPQGDGATYSTSTLDLPAHGRAPSLYLDDLFDQESGVKPGVPPHRRQHH